MRVALPSAEPATVTDAVRYVLTQPWHVFIVRWNWKTALLSGAFRTALWPLAMLARGKFYPLGSLAGICAASAYRIAVGGFWGSLLQAFAGARPAWLAGACMAVFLPGCMHSIEYLVLRAGGAAHPGAATAGSLAVSLVSVLVNWGLMRKGFLLTGAAAPNPGDSAP